MAQMSRWSRSWQQAIVGASELAEEDQAELATVQEMLMVLRRKSVSFEIMPSVAGASGPEYSKMQLERLWEGLRLGYKFQRKKQDCRAFVLSAEMFPPKRDQAGVADEHERSVEGGERALRAHH